MSQNKSVVLVARSDELFYAIDIDSVPAQIEILKTDILCQTFSNASHDLLCDDATCHVKMGKSFGLGDVSNHGLLERKED